MELARVLQAIRALRRARDGEDFVLLATGVIDGILRILAADMICFNDVGVDTAADAKRSVTLVLWPKPELSEALSWTGASGAGHAASRLGGSLPQAGVLRQPGCVH
jgi:hypothetical protein